MCLAVVVAFAATMLSVAAQDRPTIRMAYLQFRIERPLPHSFMEAASKDDGIAGARVAILDNNTTGRFTGQQATLDEAVARSEEEALEAFRNWSVQGTALSSSRCRRRLS
jgi:hypothetical protein